MEVAKLIVDARRSATVSFDPNCRPNLVGDLASYRARMNEFADGADIVRMSDVDFEYLHENRAYAARAQSVLARGASLVVITRGTKGAIAWHRHAGAVEVEAPSVEVVDTIGAGDGFQAALLFALQRLDRIERAKLKALGADDLRRALSFACRCAAMTCTQAGADPPQLDEVAAYW